MLTFQHKAVQSIAVVIKKDGAAETVTLVATRKRATTTDWFRWGGDFEKEFPTRAAAVDAGIKVCPVFTGSAGSFYELPTFAVDAWGGWHSM